MLELVPGEPHWYPRAVGGVVGVLLVALLVNRIQLEYALGSLAFAVAVIVYDRWQSRRRARFVRLMVGSDFSLTLCDSEGRDYPAETTGRSWVTSGVIVIPVKAVGMPSINLVIAADRNDADSFRRFAIICRFGFAVKDSGRHNEAHFNPQGTIK